MKTITEDSVLHAIERGSTRLAQLMIDHGVSGYGDRRFPRLDSIMRNLRRRGRIEYAQATGWRVVKVTETWDPSTR